jgi:calcium-dependent protein kinase
MKVKFLKNKLYLEFIRACINKSKLLSDDNLRRTFRLLDKDDNKSITLQELKSLLELSTKYSDKVWNQILNEIEHKIENEVSYEEFKNMMTKLIN